MASQSGPEGPWPTGARWRVLGVKPGCGFPAGGGGAGPGEPGCGFSASCRGAADLGWPRGGRGGEGGVFRWSLPLALPCGPCACSSFCLVVLRIVVTGSRWRVPWGWGWVQLYSRLLGCSCCFVRRCRCGVRSVVVHLRVRSGLVSALLRRVGSWGRWSVRSLRLSGRRLRWREGVRVVSCGRRDQRRGVRQRSGSVARVVGSASRRALEGLGHRHLPLRRSGRSRRRCLRRGRGHVRQCGRGGGGIVVGTGGVGVGRGRGLARGAVGVVVVVLAVSLALLFDRALRGLPLQLADRSRR